MQVSLTNFNSRDATRSVGDAFRVRRVLQMNGFPARQLRAENEAETRRRRPRRFGA